MFKENKGIKLGAAIGTLLAATAGIGYAFYKWDNPTPVPDKVIVTDQDSEPSMISAGNNSSPELAKEVVKEMEPI